MFRRPTNTRPLQIVAGTILAASVLYFVGLKPLLPLALIVLSALYLPVPSILQSTVGRIGASLVINLALLQLASIIQFVFLPQSNFGVIAVIYAALGLALLMWLGRQRQPIRPVVTRNDIAGFLVAALFLLPFLGIIAGQDSITRIVQIGGLQSPDAGHHFEFINSMMSGQHLDTSGYPKAFHLSAGFIQDSFIGNQAALSWQSNLVVFFGQYLIFGAALAYTLAQLCIFWASRLAKKALTKTQTMLVALALAIPLVLVILWPFVVHGFLNYLYTIIALALGMLYVTDSKSQKQPSSLLLLGLVILYSATQSWPLIAPAVLLYLALTLWPKQLPSFSKLKQFIRSPYLPIALLIALQLIPIAMQFLIQGRTSVNDQGDLRVLPTFVLLGGGVLLVFVALHKFESDFKRSVLNLFVPFTLFSGALILMQFLLLGEARYFSIKVSLLLVALFIVLAVAVLLGLAFRDKWPPKYVLLLPLMPLVTIVLLIGASPEPFKDLRNLFRDQLGQPKPAHYDHDAYLYAKLGKAGEINNFNSTILHYNSQTQKLEAHTFLAQWAQFIKYPRDELGQKAWACHRLIFHNIVYGSFTDAEQKALVAKVNECADLAHQAGRPYYIITDNDSLQTVKSLIGERAGVIYVGS